MTPSRVCFSTKGSIMPLALAACRIQLSGMIAMGRLLLQGSCLTFTAREIGTQSARLALLALSRFLAEFAILGHGAGYYPSVPFTSISLTMKETVVDRHPRGSSRGSTSWQ